MGHNSLRQSRLFGPTLREAPRNELSINARLLEQAGYIAKLMSGVYSYLPLGWLVLDKINAIIREEMASVDAQELSLPALHPKEIWEETGRWKDGADIMYQFHDHSNKEFGLGWTHEEIITSIARTRIRSYRDLPKAVFQIQTKFRNEPRAKSGLIRCREFLMKDLYSFHATEEDLDVYYEQVKAAYGRIFERCGLVARIFEASGGAFTKKFSHEFQVLCSAGEDSVLYCPECDFAQNSEISRLKPKEACPNCSAPVQISTGVEVGNIFKLGTKFSEAMKAEYVNERGEKNPIIMASYGIGPGRVLGTIVEVHHDADGICWPLSVAPFTAHLLCLSDSPETISHADSVYAKLQENGVSTLYDDRSETAGVKLADADLIGVPFRIVLSKRTQSDVEIKQRTGTDAKVMSIDKAIRFINDLTDKNHV